MTIMKYYILKNKNKRFKIIAIVLLILSRFETNFGMMGGLMSYQLYINNKNEKKTKQKKDNLVKKNKMLNENYFLVDDEDNIILVPKNEDFSFYHANSLPEDFKHIFIKENDIKKNLVSSINNIDYYMVHDNQKIPVEKVDDDFRLILNTDMKVKDPVNTIKCKLVKKNVNLDRLNDDYCLGNFENNKIEKIKEKNVVFKLLTRTKYLKLKEKLNSQDKFLKKDKDNILVNEENKPLLFEEVGNNIILYVKQKESALSLAVLNDTESIENNFFKVKIIKNSEINENNETNKVAENNKNGEENEDSPCCNC